MNVILGLICILICFTIEILIEKIFKKEGLYVWIAVASVLANILVCKTVDLFGIAASLGNIMFASNFLATDILTEKYGVKESRKAVILGIISVIGFILATQIGLLFIPSDADMVHESMKVLFSINLRTSISSVVMYGVSNLFGVWLFNKMKQKDSKRLWLRNNVTTIVSNCLENFLFVFGAFLWVLDFNTVLSIAITTSILEIVIALCDTPFLYWAVNKKEATWKY